VKEPGQLTRRVLETLLDDVVIVREAELRETLVRLALEEHVIAEGAGALALAAGRRVAGKKKCAVVSGGNLDAGVLAKLLSEVRPRPPRKPRRRVREADVATRAEAAPPLPPTPQKQERRLGWPRQPSALVLDAGLVKPTQPTSHSRESTTTHEATIRNQQTITEELPA
jgi:threonine dehydratase